MFLFVRRQNHPPEVIYPMEDIYFRGTFPSHTVDGSEIPFPTTWNGAKTL